MTGTEQRYLTACATSNLRVQAEKHGDADLMIAAGWTASRIGAALMRLHTKPTQGSLALVHTQVAIEARQLNIANPDVVTSAVLAWWLGRICPTCHGRKFDSIENTPSLSEIQCPTCHGSGEKSIPCGDSGRWLASWLDSCKAANVDLIKRRLWQG